MAFGKKKKNVSRNSSKFNVDGELNKTGSSNKDINLSISRIDESKEESGEYSVSMQPKNIDGINSKKNIKLETS